MELINPRASKENIVQSLQWCVKMGHSDILKALLITHFSNSKLSDMSDICSDLLIRVVSQGSCDLLNLILPYVDDKFLSKENKQMGKNYLSKMLCHAVTKGDRLTVELLIKKGANMNSFYEGKPLLHVAINGRHSEIARILINNGANVDAALIPVIISSMENKDELTSLILEKGVNPKQMGSNGKQPLHIAAAHSAAIVTRLVDVGCDVNTQDPIHGDTPLHIACSMCCTETVEALIKNGAKFNVRNNQGETPLYKLLKFATNRHDFHSQSRLKLAEFLVNLGFTAYPINSQKKHQRGRDKVFESFKNVLSSSKNVFMLQHLCRLNIRESVNSSHVRDSLESFELPRTLIGYLKFDNGFHYNTVSS